ncbi:YtxH domain-containing protein [Streptococcus pneumoniae]
MGKLSSILLGTISGAAAAAFLTSKKGKEVTAKVVDFVNDVKENPEDFKVQAVDTWTEFSNQAASTISETKEKVENGEITGETILESVKETTKQVIDFSQDKFEEIKGKLNDQDIVSTVKEETVDVVDDAADEEIVIEIDLDEE